MINGENQLKKTDRISNRIHILSNLEAIIKESVYYRSYSEELNNCSAIYKICLSEKENKIKIL